jgi:hypothetical protein
MSSGSERMIENQQYRYDESNAAKMGITVVEFHSCEYEYEGDVVTYIQFDRDNSPKEILDKIALDDQDRFEIYDDGEDLNENKN